MNEGYEKSLGVAWFDGIYTQQQAELSCELQGLNWQLVVNAFAEEYESMEKVGSISWN